MVDIYNNFETNMQKIAALWSLSTSSYILQRIAKEAPGDVHHVYQIKMKTQVTADTADTKWVTLDNALTEKMQVIIT